MKNILFVDDEPKILQGLGRMLRTMRTEWEMVFVDSGEKALTALSQRPFDVVVTDMRMPNMNGAELLTRVKQDYPDIVRIILSGHSDREMILRSIGPTHQFLSKPCNAEKLKRTITRACVLRELLTDRSLKNLVAGIDSLPSLPAAYTRIVEEAAAPNASIKKIGAIISSDVGMTAKIMHLINSAFFGLPRHISDPVQAVSLLGLETIKTLVLTVQIFSRVSETGIHAHLIELLFHHSVTVGAWARCICISEKCEKHVVDEALLSGVVHHVGSLVLATNMPDTYATVLQLARSRNIPVDSVEKELFGSTHNEIGAYLLGLWAFPDPIVEAVAYCNYPSRCPARNFAPLTAVHAANVFDRASALPNEHATPVPALDISYLDAIPTQARSAAWQNCYQPVSKEQ